MQVVEIKPTIDKVTKISKLQPKYAIANVFHNSDDKNTRILEDELRRFPKGVHDDMIDCLSNIIAIMLPAQKEVQRQYSKYANAKKKGSHIMY
jgi:phage terminase large subunit-like protein